MIILHAGFVDEQFLLWGETAVESSEAFKQRKTNKASDLNVLPYDAGFKKISQALIDSGYSYKAYKRDMLPAVIWLPSKGAKPFASSPIIDAPPATRYKITITPWQINVLPLNAKDTIELLCHCAGKELLSPGVLIGNDLAYWSSAMRYCGALTARQQFIPDVVKKDEEFRAYWKPVIAGEERKNQTELAKAMPGACRALSFDIETEPTVSSQSLLSDFCNMTVDFLVRYAHMKKTAPSKPKRLLKKKSSSFDSIHDQWLHALCSPDGLIEGDENELTQFMAQVQAWKRPVTVSTDAPFRLCFRLEEPGTEIITTRKTKKFQDSWFVRYLLQDISDPSLLLPVDEVWNAKGQKAAFLKKAGFNANEYLLFSLGQASGICPDVENSLKTSAPGGYAIDSDGAFNFLNEKSSILEQMSFGVLLPSWWTRKGTKQRLSIKAKVKSPRLKGGGGLTLSEIIEFEWEMALGGKKITLRELQELAKMKSSLVQIRGQWVHISAEEIKEAIAFWKKREKQEASVGELVQMSLGRAKAPAGLEFDGVSATGWIAKFLKQLNGNASYDEIEPLPEFQGILRPYQKRGYSWLNFLQQWGLGACLADDMGLGKTIQTLTLIQRNWHNNGKRPVLLICPTSVVGNWHKEASRFTPELPVMIHHGTTRAKGAAFKKEASKHSIVISSYALLHRDFEILKEIPWSGVVLDEAQNIKNPETKQSKAARSLNADYRIALTGTPVENNVGDLWSIMEFLNPGFLGTQAEFKRSFFVPIQAERDPEAIQKLKQMTGPFILRRLKTDKTIISDLPEKMEMKVFCNLTKEQASLYQAVVNDTEKALESAEGINRKGLVLATISKLKQVCNHPAHFAGDNSAMPDRSGKLNRLTEMLEEMIGIGDRALIFSQFSVMGGMLQTYLQEQFGQEVFFLHGGVTKKKRDAMVERFQSDQGPSIFILSLKAGGTGLNLTHANHVFHFDRWWNPAVENQATDRVFRIGQTKNVQVHKYLCVGTLEERIDEMIENKKEIAEGVVGAGEAWLTELSTDELKELFKLSKDAVAE